MDEAENKFLGIDERLSFLSDVNSKINGLNFQLERIFSVLPPRGVSPVHDVDYYVVLLRRAYREIEKQAKIDSRVGNLKGKYKNLVRKIKIRDHFEHGVNFETLPAVNPADSHLGLRIGQGVKVATSLIANTIISGSFAWSLPADHIKFIEMFNEYAQLFPFVNTNSTPAETSQIGL